MNSITLRRLALSASAIVATLAVTTVPAATMAAAPYQNGFEKAADTVPGQRLDTDATKMYDVDRVDSKTTGPISAASGRWYGVAATNAYAFTRLGGYNSQFPAGGYTTSVDIYLDMALANGPKGQFDWSSAINNTSGNHRRDFIFSVGTDPSVPGSFIMSASNNAPGDPANPARDPLTISQSGWYTFKHSFVNRDGVLAVDMSVADAAGTTLKTWTLSDPSDIIGDTVGGNRYAWLVDNGFASLAIDNVTRK